MNATLAPSRRVGSKTRILQFFSRYKEYGGEEGSVYRIGDALSSEFDVGTFLASSRDVFPGGFVKQGIGTLKAFSNWGLTRQLRRYQMLGRYDCWLIHNVFPAMSPAVYSLAFELGVPVIQYLHNYRMGCVNGFFMNHGKPCQLCMHGNFVPAFRTACWHDSHIQSGIMGAIMMRTRQLDLFSHIHHWVAISEAQRQEHIKMGVPEERISVIHHFLEPETQPPAYPEDGDVVFIGRLSQEKGVHQLLLAWERIQGCGRQLWIVGDGPERGRLEAMVQARSLRNVKFTGFLDHASMSEIWGRAACLMTPSIWIESFGMVILESWAKGRPVVAHRIGALTELIDEGVNGLLVDPDSPQAMADAILTVIQNPKMGASMGNHGHAKLLNQFDKAGWLTKISGVINGANLLQS